MPDLEALLAEYIERLNAGEALDVDSIRREHPDVADDLISELRLFQGIVPAPSEEQPLGTLGDYTLRRQIGRGGMGVVYEAWENSMDRRVALKVLPAGIAADARASARFLREAQTAGKLDHRNIVRVYSTGVREGTPWYSMEFVEGQTLAKIAAAMRAAPSDAPTPFGQSREHLGFYSALAAAFADVADGLQHAHAEGVVHRDIKPSNLILDHQGRLRILDFGLARLEGQESLTFSGDLVGTVRYMSPEQAQARKIPIDHRTDVYSLGATMYEMLALRPPFEGKDHRETLGQIIERDPVEPRRVNPRVPKDLETIVLKCLRKDPRDRYGTAEALAQDLRRFVRGDPIEARPQSGWERLAARVRRHKKILFAAAAFLTLLLAVAWFAYQERRAHERRMADAYEPAVLRVLRELLGREFSLRVVARQAEGLFQFEQLGFVLADRPDGALLPVTPEDFAALREAQGSHAIDEAIEELLKVADIRPHRPDAHYHLAKAYELIGRLEEARTEILRALDCDPDFVPAKVLRVRLQGLDEKSLEFETIFREYCERDDWRRWWVEAYKEVKETRWPEAAEAYGKLIAFWAGGAEPYIGSAIEAHIGRGLAYLETKQFMRALGDFRAACTLAPGFVEGTLLIGTAFYLAGRAEHVDEWRNEAEEIFEKLLARASFRERKEVVLWIAALYDSFKDFSLGLEWEEKLGEGPLADRLRAYFRYARGDVKDAIEAGRSAISGNAEDLIAHLVLAAALRCALWRQRGPERERTLSELLRVSRRALELDPQRASAREHLAVAVEQGGFSPDGLEVIDTGIDGKVFGQTPSDDERTLYFSRFDGNPRGDVDIYFMTRADRSEPFSVPARPVEG
ncbi:MAG: protein kinase, partial [Planctomycetes bacterium]|nr:protein kinase [Planctomycetota bacterium]